MYLLKLSLVLCVLTNVNILTVSLPPRSSSTYGRDRFIANSRCLDLETGRELHVGDSFTRSGRCISVQCLDTLELWEDRCQVPQLEGNCSRLPVGNEFLDYPRCCPTYECTSYKSDDNSITYETRTYDRYGRLLTERITQRRLVLVQPPGHLTTRTTNENTADWNRKYTRVPNPPLNSVRRDNLYEIKYN